MLYEYISTLFGIIKILFYKLVYPKRLHFSSIPKINHNLRIAIKKSSKLVIGKNLRARNNVSFRIYDKGILNVGNNCFFNDGCSINCQEKITIGNNLICGQNVMFFDHDHDYKNEINNFVREEIKVGDNVWIGANSLILKGVTIGDNVVIAAGSIVKDDVESNTLYYQQIKGLKRKK